MNKVFITMAFLLLFAGFSQAKLLEIGSESKKFLNFNLDGQHEGLKNYVGPAAKLKKNAVVLSFWSTTCIPCRKEMPVVQSWGAKYSDQVQVFYINVDKKDSTESAKRFLEQIGVKGAVLLDFYQVTAKAYGVCEGTQCSLPALFMIDSKGIIRMAQTGYDESHDLSKKLDEVYKTTCLGEAPKQVPETINNAEKFKVLHNILVSLNHAELAKKNGLTKEQIVEILKESEQIVKKQWGIKE